MGVASQSWKVEKTIIDSIGISWMSQLQAMMEPISRITKFFSLIPLFRIDNQEERS